MSWIIRREGELGNENNEVGGRFAMRNHTFNTMLDLAHIYDWKEDLESDEDFPNLNYIIGNLKELNTVLKRGLSDVELLPEDPNWQDKTVISLEDFQNGNFLKIAEEGITMTDRTVNSTELMKDLRGDVYMYERIKRFTLWLDKVTEDNIYAFQ